MIIRTTDMNEIASIQNLQSRAIRDLQTAYLTAAQIKASEASMGLDTQLIEDGTYFCVFDHSLLVGCGGWSYRATLYGGNHSAGRSVRALDPKTERARIRAMYTDPDHVRRGIGRLILATSEAAAKAHGFSDLEMAATEAGRPFYERCGYVVENKFFDEGGAVPVPLYTMIKSI